MPLYDVAILHLITPLDFWQNSTPFFGAAAFCKTKIGDFIRRPSQSFSTIVLVNFVVFSSTVFICMFQSCVLGAHLTQPCCDFFILGQATRKICGDPCTKRARQGHLMDRIGNFFYRPQDNGQTGLYSLVLGQSIFHFQRNMHLKMVWAILAPPPLIRVNNDSFLGQNIKHR